MQKTTHTITSLAEFIKDLNEDSLNGLLQELEQKPKNFSVYYNRPKEDWLRRYPDCGDDIHTFLHAKEEGMGIDY
jgi:hypothetical protein